VLAADVGRRRQQERSPVELQRVAAIVQGRDGGRCVRGALGERADRGIELATAEVAALDDREALLLQRVAHQVGGRRAARQPRHAVVMAVGDDERDAQRFCVGGCPAAEGSEEQAEDNGQGACAHAAYLMGSSAEQTCLNAPISVRPTPRVPSLKPACRTPWAGSIWITPP